MAQVTARLPDDLVARADGAASRLNRSRAQVLRQALEYYLDDFEDLRLALDRLNDPADPVLDWQDSSRFSVALPRLRRWVWWVSVGAACWG